MSARDWIEKDFYGELGVSSSATAEEIKKSYRKLARELHPDANPGDAAAESRFKSVSEAYAVLSDPEKRRQYDEARSLFGGGRGGFDGFSGGNTGFDFGNIFGGGGGAGGGQGAGGGGGFSDLFGGLFGKRGGGAGSANRARRGSDVEAEVRIEFVDAVKGATVLLRLSSPTTCGTCGGDGAAPGTSPRICPSCSGSGLVTRNQGAFAFSEPCRDCRGNGKIIDTPCGECGGDGISTRTRALNIRIPAGVEDGQQIRLSGQGEPGRNGASAGDLYVRVHVSPHEVFGRSGNDLTLSVPVTFPELALGTTLTIPTLDSSVTVRVPSGTASGRVLRVRGRGVVRKDGQAGDLLITLQVHVPSTVDDKARAALEAYAEASAGADPRAGLNALLQEKKKDPGET
ncbi:molecular chaperone DnaJ [Allokutzneria multivorans]|uniref:Chaperone protein DnaJ n=1 Tax=Allokutzneria multivorans TaxID=1142134 RepID=A0ABP7RLD4_9PSEU